LVELRESRVALKPNAESSIGPAPNLSRILTAIEGLAEEEREVFDLVRLQGLSHGEAAQVVGVSVKTVQRRLKRSLVLLSARLGDLSPGS
jgi:RNA polymerase sigma-70 factor (ECF subfamily)